MNKIVAEFCLGLFKPRKAAGLPPTAPRSSRSDEARSASVAEPGPLPGGPAKWREIVERRLSEARRVFEGWQREGFIYEAALAKERVTELAELICEVERSETEGPAGNVKLSTPDESK